MKNKIYRFNKLTLLLVSVAIVTGFVIGRQSTQSDLFVDGKKAGIEFSDSLSDTQQYYVCPMHPEVTSDSPGSCPICGMDLVLHKHGKAETDAAHAHPVVTISPEIIHNLGIRLATAVRGDLPHNIETIGKITRIDHTARRIITPPISGTLTFIAEKYSGDEVSKGELLFKISSPQLLEQQKKFLQLSADGETAAASAMIPQLLGLGLTEQQISELQSGQTNAVPVEVYAREDGYIFTRRGEVGDAVPTSFTVFNIGSNYQVVEVTAEIFERQWGWVAEGQKATMQVRGLPGISFGGTVVDVEPPVGYTTRSLEVRLKFKTDHPGLSQSMFAHVSIIGKKRRQILMVPRQSVIRSEQGERVVLFRQKGLYQPVQVVAGEESESMIEIISGLEEGDLVVSSGQFLIDSESDLQSAFLRMSAQQQKR